MPPNILNEVKSQEKNKAIETLIANSSPRQSYYFMVGLSVAMATMGMLLDSTAVVIGSMLIAPVLYPVLSLSMGVIILDRSLVWRSLVTLIFSVLLALTVSITIAAIFSFQQPEFTNEVIKRTAPNSLNFAVALVAGLAVSFAIAKPQINESMPGVAISVSLVPPLAVVGIGLSKLDFATATPAMVLFAINIIGIMSTAMVMFLLLRFTSKKSEVHKEVKKDEKILTKD